MGQCLGRVWSRLLSVQCVFNRSLDSTARAVDFIGAGQPIERLDQLIPTDWVMISVPDDRIESVCASVVASGALKPGAVVFHCSGSCSSALLESAQKKGALIASIHPVKSFANPAIAAETFAGTPCGIEGSEEACKKLERLAELSGAKPFRLNSETKLLYHAGTVMVCNYLTALLETGLRCYEASGIPRERALELAAPIIAETIRNNYNLGSAAALTGPISRGDARLVAAQLAAVEKWNGDIGQIYRALGVIAAELAEKKGVATPESLAKILQTIRQGK